MGSDTQVSTTIDDIMRRVTVGPKMTTGAAAAEAAATPGRLVEQRLRRKFGLGDCPAKRIALYRQLEKIVEEHGEPAEVCISEAVAESINAHRPDRYFCAAVKRKLQDRGFTRSSTSEAQW